MTLFGTAGIRGPVAEHVSPDLAVQVGRAAGRDGSEFVVGHDGRVTSPALADAIASGLASGGADVLRIGTVPTPALAYASRGRRGVMITASHNPPTDNGIKLFCDGEEYSDDAEDRIEARIDDGTRPVVWDEWGQTRTQEVLESYRSAVVEYATQYGARPDGLRIAVDCGNGMASVATPHVLDALGAEVIGTEANVDGHFPARGSKPTPETLTTLCSFVADTDTDMGIGHDGDADRIVIVDSNGEIVHEDTIVAMLAEEYTRASTTEDPVVVTTPNASGRIDERVAAAGGRTERVRLGALHEGSARERSEGSDGTEIVFAAEPWKHIHPNHGGWIDGVASAAVLTRLVAAEGLTQRRDPITERPYRKRSIDCPDTQKETTMSLLADRLPEAFPDANADTAYGVRLSFPDESWTLVRPSGTEPYIRLYAEHDDVESFSDRLTEIIESAVMAAGENTT